MTMNAVKSTVIRQPAALFFLSLEEKLRFAEAYVIVVWELGFSEFGKLDVIFVRVRFSNIYGQSSPKPTFFWHGNLLVYESLVG